MEIVILKQAEKELKDAPKEILEDIYSLFHDLMQGKILGMPISRPLPSIAKGLHELRLSSRSGEFRVFYLILTAPLEWCFFQQEITFSRLFSMG